MLNQRQREEVTGWLFVLPFLVSLGLFFLYAAGRTLVFSFTDFNLFNNPAFVGVANYINLLSDRLFLLALGTTLGFAVVVTVLQTFLALLLAIQVNRAVRGKSFVRTVFYTPSIMSSAAMTLIFLWLFQREGLMTQLVQFFANNRWYVAAFIGISIPVQALLLFLAGLQSIPIPLYEAAKIDGANAFQRFRDITVPSIAPVTFAVVTMGIIGTLQMFDQVAILGDAAPIESRVTLAYYIYENAFPGGATSRIGTASAAAMILGLLTLAVVYLQRALGIRDTVK